MKNIQSVNEAYPGVKVTFIVDALYSIAGGTERQLFVLIQSLIKRGYDVDLQVLRHSDFTRSVKDFPCKIKCLEIYSIFSIRTMACLFKLWKWINVNKPDVVHIFFNDAAILCPLFCKRKTNKILTSRRDMGIWYTKMKLLALRMANVWVDKIVCNSKAVAEYTIKKEHLKQSKSRVIYNGIEEYEQCSELPCDLSDGSFTIGIVANVRPVKNFEDIIKAVSILKKSDHAIRCIVIGHISDEVYYSKLVGLIDSLNLNDEFEFLGSLDEPRQYLHLFDVGVLCSLSEGLSNTLIEYTDAGIPVVCSAVGGNPEIIGDNQNGLLYPVGDAAELAVKLEKLILDGNLSKTLANAAKVSASRFTYHTMVEQYEKEYNQ